jgi:hypothetical protein
MACTTSPRISDIPAACHIATPVDALAVNRRYAGGRSRLADQRFAGRRARCAPLPPSPSAATATPASPHNSKNTALHFINTFNELNINPCYPSLV